MRGRNIIQYDISDFSNLSSMIMVGGCHVEEKAVAGREKAERILARKTAIMNSVPNIRRRSKIVRELVEEILKYEKALHEIENMIDRYSQDEHRAKESIPEIFAELELRGNQYPHAGPL